MAANEVRFAVETIESPPVGVESEYECDLLIEALSRELTVVKVMLHVVGCVCLNPSPCRTIWPSSLIVCTLRGTKGKSLHKGKPLHNKGNPLHRRGKSLHSEGKPLCSKPRLFPPHPTGHLSSLFSRNIQERRYATFS